MKNLIFLFILLFLAFACSPESAPRVIKELNDNWKFINKDIQGAELPATPDTTWEDIRLPHDWAISGEFYKNIDSQTVIVYEDGEQVPQLRTGRTGALPHTGTGWYRKNLTLPKEWKDKRIHLEFDGAMSHAKIFLNGDYVGQWPYGYSSFGFDITEYIKPEKENILAVRLENQPKSSRWYPGAGIYRDVRMVVTENIHVKQWGTFVSTPDIKEGKGNVKIENTILNHTGEKREIEILTDILDEKGNIVVNSSDRIIAGSRTTLISTLEVSDPQLWSPEHPVLYKAITHIQLEGKTLDRYETVFGFRYFEFTPDEGFFLNGKPYKLKGVCLHHDLGPLGAAYNHASMKHRMKLLQEMGCNAIRTSHNPPAPGLLTLADEMGFLIIDEAFDEWKKGKLENGYHTLWDTWSEKDLVALIHRDRNHPGVIAWSIGNEVPDQNTKDGLKHCKFLVDICKREDPTRPVTAGFNRWQEAIRNGLAEAVDLPGWNYKPQHYAFIHSQHPDWKMYGSETSSTVSSRGEYFLPAEQKVHYTRTPYHCSSYDMEHPGWATPAEREFAAQDSFPFIAGEFVWTGFDYLGEPTPYNAQWPSRSSYFGIIDLCGIPKDRYYLYQSKWTDKEVLHLLPHWNWEKGQRVSVHCYTGFDRAELFLNGKSLGIKEKDPSGLFTTYRLIWDSVTYEPGELKVVALDNENNPLMETSKKTAGSPHHLIIESDREVLKADGKDLAFLTFSVADQHGILCPLADNLIRFSLKGKGKIRAVGNGDPTSLESFVKPLRKAFNGKCMLIVQSEKEAGSITLTAETDGMETVSYTLKTK